MGNKKTYDCRHCKDTGLVSQGKNVRGVKTCPHCDKHPTVKVRNWLAVHAHFRTGAGAQGKNKYTRKEKHKNKEY